MAELNTARPAALILSPETPYPLHGGGALRTASVLQYLARNREIDLIMFRHRREQNPLAALPPGLARRVLVIDLPFHSKDLPSRLWRNGLRFVRGVPPLVDRFRDNGQRIAGFVAGHHYEVAVIEHFWCAEYQPILRAVSDVVVLNLHNLESMLHATSAKASSGLGRWMHKRFAAACRALEQKWLPEFSELLTASLADAGRVQEISPAATPRVFANSIPWTEIPTRLEENVIAFSGNLEYHPNQEAVRFFAAKIWPHLSRTNPMLQWRLIGMNSEAVRPSLSGCANLQFTGSVLDAVYELAAAKVVVVPILSGSGTRLKIVEAWAAGRAVVSTRLGAEGLPACDGGNILLADTPRDFISCITKLLLDPDLRRALGDAGRKEYERTLCWEAAWKALDSSWLAPNSVHSAEA